MKIKNALNSFLMQKQLECKTAATIRSYKSFIGFFIEYVGDDISTLKISLDNVNNYSLELINKGLSKNTVACYLRHLKVFIKYCEERKYIRKKISSKMIIPKTTKRTIRLLTVDEINEIFDCIKRSYSEPYLQRRNILIVTLMLNNGLRLSEVANLKISDFIFSESYFIVTGKGEKTRRLPLDNSLRTILIHYLSVVNPDKVQDDILLYTKSYKPITTNCIKLFITKLRKATGFDFSSHKLRHNFATNYCIDGYNYLGSVDLHRLKILLGHSDISTTYHYLHLANEILLAKNYKSHFDLLGIASFNLG